MLQRFIATLPRHVLLVLVCVLMVPVLALWGAWLPVGSGAEPAMGILQEMSATVLPSYVWTTVQLSVLVAVGVTLVGLGAAGLAFVLAPIAASHLMTGSYLPDPPRASRR